VLDQAARLQSRQRVFNLTVTNVPGPQVPLYLLGRRLEEFYPQVPLVLNTALGIAIMSYDANVFFGLLGDYDAMPDLDALAGDLDAAIAELARAAGVKRPRRARPRRAESVRA
jgi:diacylglycerol O-acyltransferase / wax synthase